MLADPTQALRCALGLLGWAIALQCLEDWQLARSVLARRVATWPVLGSDLARSSPRGYALLGLIFAPHRARLWLGLRLGCAVLLMAQVAMHAVRIADCFLVVPLWMLHLLSQVRWRGALNGGSDLMTLSMLNSFLLGYLLSLLMAEGGGWAPGSGSHGLDPSFLPERAALWLICIHLLTSYFVSGTVKLLQPAWRQGTALRHFLDTAVHGPLHPGSWLRVRWISALLAWSFMVWEALMPLSLLHPWLAVAACLLAALFHLLVFVYFGLNRFLWIWIAGFPALLFAAAEVDALLR